MQEKLVLLGAATCCATCNRELPKGARALRRSTRAVTYYERLHMDGRGQVNYYHHEACRQPAQSPRG